MALTLQYTMITYTGSKCKYVYPARTMGISIMYLYMLSTPRMHHVVFNIDNFLEITTYSYY